MIGVYRIKAGKDGHICPQQQQQPSWWITEHVETLSSRYVLMYPAYEGHRYFPMGRAQTRPCSRGIPRNRKFPTVGPWRYLRSSSRGIPKQDFSPRNAGAYAMDTTPDEHHDDQTRLFHRQIAYRLRKCERRTSSPLDVESGRRLDLPQPVSRKQASEERKHQEDQELQ